MQPCWWSSGLRGPGAVVADHGVEDDEDLADARDKSDASRFSCRSQRLVKGLEDRVAAGSSDGGHVERGPHVPAPAPDAALSAERAAVAVDWSDTYERGDLLSAQLPELRQL